MASAIISLSTEGFLCSICLDVFTEPVSTPCGHNYCKACIKHYWSTSNVSQCPLCKEDFHGAPELRVNTEFRDMLEVFKRMAAAGDDNGSPARPGEVPCDLCHGTKRKALKSCLVCLASYCNAHLEPHHTVQALKWHHLINPVNLEDRVCKKHNRVMEFFCRREQSCVCVVCLKDDHVMHEYVSLEVEFNERKTKLQHMKRRVSRMLSKKCTKASEIKTSMMQDQQEVKRTKAETVKVFTALESKKVKLMELLEEKQRAAERRAEALIRQLQLEIDEDNWTRIELEEFSKTEDDFRLLQDLPSISSPSNIKHHLLQLDAVRSAVAKMEETLDEQMENIIRELSLVDKEETVEEPVQAEKVFDDVLGKIQSQYAINVTLDPNTAHPSLILSEDRKQVRDGGAKRKVPDKPMRFDFYHFVLGNEGFSSGRFYYEVLVKGQKVWEVGVTRESISRKGVALSLSPENGCWTLGSYWGRCQANASPPVVLSLSKNPEKVGVFVDYEGGLVCFYNVDARFLMYSFTRCVFTEGASRPRNLSALKVHNDAQAKTRIFPLFRPSAEWREPAPLQITPVSCTREQ
ncbi:E3 ubiquitin-protein ligase TRIM39-like [Pagrus major]|uniref:E3 ubiquitin-protein ligase TRIM39-like n=1 Tax=Pagrus major TaxID=143350 RepID=UPI003CC8ACF9